MMTRKHPWRRTWPLAAVVSIAVALLASGCMWGTVRDPVGNRLPGVTVSYSDSDGSEATTTTDANGEYFFGAPPAPEPPHLGPATFHLSAPGFVPLTETRHMAYDDNPNATPDNLGSYREVQDFALSGAPPPLAPSPLPAPPPLGITPATVLTADLALTDIYPDYLPVGSLYIRITNHGPHSVKGIEVDLDCYLWWFSSSTPLTTSQWINPKVAIYLDPGQTVAVPMNAQVHTDQYQYVAGCDLGVPLNIDPNKANNHHSENIS